MWQATGETYRTAPDFYAIKPQGLGLPSPRARVHEVVEELEGDVVVAPLPCATTRGSGNFMPRLTGGFLSQHPPPKRVGVPTDPQTYCGCVVGRGILRRFTYNLGN